MQYTNYAQLKKETENLVGQMKYQEALQVLKTALEHFPQEEFDKYFADIMIKQVHCYRMCEMNEEFVQTLTVMLEHGLPVWRWLVDELPWEENSIYRELKEKNDQLLTEKQKAANVQYVVHLPEGYTEKEKYPLFLALHGGGGNMEEFSLDWKPDTLLNKGFIFVYVQSSQVSWGNGYNWNDCTIVRKDLKKCYEQIVEKYAVNQNCVLLGGFCGGAIATLEVAFANEIPLKGFIAVSPDEKPDSFTEENVQAAVKRGLKGVFTEGELLLPVPAEDAMMRVFDQQGFAYEYYINEGIGLSIPDDLPAKLEKAVQFILG